MTDNRTRHAKELLCLANNLWTASCLGWFVQQIVFVDPCITRAGAWKCVAQKVRNLIGQRLFYMWFYYAAVTAILAVEL